MDNKSFGLLSLLSCIKTSLVIFLDISRLLLRACKSFCNYACSLYFSGDCTLKYADKLGPVVYGE